MKYYFLGILTVLTLSYSSNYAWYKGLDDNNDKLNNLGRNIQSFLNGEKTIEVVTGRCRNIEGKRMNQRVWFNCNKFQIFISDLIYGDK